MPTVISKLKIYVPNKNSFLAQIKFVKHCKCRRLNLSFLLTKVSDISFEDAIVIWAHAILSTQTLLHDTLVISLWVVDASFLTLDSILFIIFLSFHINSRRGRVVKALDLKSNGLCPRRFEPCRLRENCFELLLPLCCKSIEAIIIPMSIISNIKIIVH